MFDLLSTYAYPSIFDREMDECIMLGFFKQAHHNINLAFFGKFKRIVGIINQYLTQA